MLTPHVPLVLLAATLMTQACHEPAERIADTFDAQGHRGARGLHPENTIPGFLAAVEHGMTTLELDLAVSADGQLVVSHEPWFNPTICELDGTGYTEDTSLYGLSYAEIAAVDCGSRGNADYPRQRKAPAAKPLLREVVRAADSLAAALGQPAPRYNVELKYRDAYADTFAPPASAFASRVADELERLGIADRSTVQSFHPGALTQMRELRDSRPALSSLELALLSENPLDWQTELDELGWEPEIYSPYHLLTTGGHVAGLHARGIRVVPWTVNDVTRMRALIDRGVDGLITDYPDRLARVLEERGM